MKVEFMFAAAMLTTMASLAVPQIDQDEVRLSGRNVLTVNYTLRGEPAVVTAMFETNVVGDVWSPIDDSATVNMTGDVNKVVGASGSLPFGGQIAWDVRHIAKNRKNVRIRAKLTAWATNAPPDWMVIDLAQANTVRYYASTNALPGGFGDDRYKLDKLLMRKVHAAGVEARLGVSLADINKLGLDSGEFSSRVAGFSRDYYLAIYETTQAQYSNAYVNAKMSLQWGADINRTIAGIGGSEGYVAPKNPVGYSDWTQLRGATSEGADWPTNRDPLPTSFLGSLRTFTGIDVDLPTESQWEYACRAGTDTAYNDGTYSPDGVTWTGEPKIREVGTLAPNAWGFCDMPFNVVEICLDHYNGSSDVDFVFQLDPEGALTSAEGYNRVTRGGWAGWSWGNAKFPQSGYRYRRGENSMWNARYANIGFRMAAPAEAK